jgi:hypothetical protein
MSVATDGNSLTRSENGVKLYGVGVNVGLVGGNGKFFDGITKCIAFPK